MVNLSSRVLRFVLPGIAKHFFAGFAVYCQKVTFCCCICSLLLFFPFIRRADTESLSVDLGEMGKITIAYLQRHYLTGS